MAPGAGFEPARGGINSAVPSQLGYPGIILVGNLGVEPSVLCVPGAADPRNFKLDGPSGLEPESQASEACALSPWAMDRSTKVGQVSNLRRVLNPPLQRDYKSRAGCKPAPLFSWGGRRKSNPRERLHRPPPSHSATATPGARSATAILANLVEEEGIEPPSADCRSAVLPLNDSPDTSNWLRAGESNATRVAYEASMIPVHLPAMEPRARFELTYPDYRSGASPSMLTGLVNLEPMERIERSSVAYHATALPLSYIGWSQRRYSKPRPPRYECGALPLELLRR